MSECKVPGLLERRYRQLARNARKILKEYVQ